MLADGALFILFEAALSPGSPDPAALEHRQLRWAAGRGIGRAGLGADKP